MYYHICMVLKWTDVTQLVWDRVSRYGCDLVSAQSSVVSNIKQTVVLFIYILQQITPCYILQVLLLWQKYITWTLTLLLWFIRQLSNSVCELQYWKKVYTSSEWQTIQLLHGKLNASFFRKSILQKCKVQKSQIQYRPTLLLYGEILQIDA